MEDDREKSAPGRVFNQSTRKVLHALKSVSSEKGACLAVKELAVIIERSESTVRRALKILTETGAIKTLRHDGDYRNGGMTNCYQIDTPLSLLDDTPLPVIVTDPLPFDTPLSLYVEYVRAAGEKESVSPEKQKTKDRRTDSVKPIDTSESIPGGPSGDVEKATNAFEGSVGMLTDAMRVELAGHVVFYGLNPVMVAMSNAAIRQRKGGLRDPMMYIRQTLASMTLEGKLAGLSASKSVPHSSLPYSPTCDLTNHRSTPPPQRVHPKQLAKPEPAPEKATVNRILLDREKRLKAEKELGYVPRNPVQRGS